MSGPWTAICRADPEPVTRPCPRSAIDGAELAAAISAMTPDVACRAVASAVGLFLDWLAPQPIMRVDYGDPATRMMGCMASMDSHRQGQPEFPDLSQGMLVGGWPDSGLWATHDNCGEITAPGTVPLPTGLLNSEREQFLDWLYEHPNEIMSRFRDREMPAQPARRSYLPPPVVRAQGDSTDTRARIRPVKRLPAPSIPRPIREIARAALDPEDPWTWSEECIVLPPGFGVPTDATRAVERDEVWRYRLMELRDAGLITYVESESRRGRPPEASSRGTLTDAGREDVERRAEQRRLRVDEDLIRHRTRQAWRRQTAALEGLLRWLSEQDPDGEQRSYVDGVLESRHAQFEGEHLPESLFRLAAEELQANGLIRGDAGAAEIRGPIAAQITYRGRDLIQSGGNVADYIRHHREPSPPLTSTGPVFLQSTVNGAQLAWGNGSVTQNGSTVQQVTPGSESLAEAITDLLQRLPMMELSPEAEEDAEAAGQAILAEVVRNEPRPGPIRRGLTVIRSNLGLIAAGGAAGVAAGVSDGAQEAARIAIERLASF